METKKELITKIESLDFYDKAIDWIEGQFSDWYNPSPARLKRFLTGFILEMTRSYKMDINNLTYDSLIDDWCIDEAFNEEFLD